MKVISRARPRETVVGAPDDKPDLVAVIRFHHVEAIRTFLASAARRGVADRWTASGNKA